MNNKILKGFTLMELLTVVAIIGIVATIIFVSISQQDSVGEASDAQVKSQMSAVRSRVISSFFESDPNGYQNVEADSEVLELLSSLKNSDVESSISAWAVKAELINGNYYCRDSAEKTSEALTQDITDFACD